jgi:predicted  nucleic acid-binding Zn-ribbon protein
MDEQLFPQQPALQKTPVSSLSAATPMATQITGLATRLKLVEERYTNLARRNQLTEGSLLGFERDSKTELRVLSKQLSDLRKRISEINSKLDAITGELGTVVRKHEFNTVERYIDLWQPMDFVSRDEARRLIADALAMRDAAVQNDPSLSSTSKGGGA